MYEKKITYVRREGLEYFLNLLDNAFNEELIKMRFSFYSNVTD